MLIFGFPFALLGSAGFATGVLVVDDTAGGEVAEGLVDIFAGKVGLRIGSATTLPET